jgi:hypothetical protein
MKKLWAIPLLLLYLVSVSGLRLPECHSCCALTAVLADLTKDPCGSPGKKDCCGDPCRMFSVRDSRQASVPEGLRTPAPAVTTAVAAAGLLSLPSFAGPTPQLPPPPLPSGLPLYLCHNRLMI